MTGTIKKISQLPAITVANASDVIPIVQSGTTSKIQTDNLASSVSTMLSLGTMATQSAASVNITGGSITGVTDIAVSDGGTGSSTAAGARTNLGLVIGTDVQAYDADLATWSGITPGTGVGTALAVNVGSSGAFTTFNGALGTPSSGTLTNATGLPIAGLVASTSTAIGVGSVELGHATDTTLTRSSAGNVAVEGNLIYRAGGTDVPVTDGGTGSSTAADARTALAVVGLTDLAASTGAALVGSIQTGTGATARTVQAKQRDIVSVKDFGATGDGVTNDRAAIQAAIDAVSTAGGGTLLFPNGKYVLGTTGITTSNNIILQGDSTRYAGTTTRGTSLVYTGTGNCIFGQNVLDVQINDIDLDCTGTTGTTVRGIYFTGAWKNTLRNVTIRGVTRAKGYGILIDTVGTSAPFGAQHNYLEQIECSDGVVRILGASGSDGVTTTVLNTIRGMQYQIVSSQVVCINTTAETWVTGAGFDFSGAGCYGLMLGCDIEGAGSPGILIDANAEVREVGTIWGGFTGALKVSGVMGSLRSYGGALTFIRALTQDVAVRSMLYGDNNVDNYVEDWVTPTNVSGGTQAGYRYWTRRNAGTSVTDHDWKDHAFLRKNQTVASTSAQTLWTIPIPNGQGLHLSAHVCGTQTGDDVYSSRRECVVRNAFGVASMTQDAVTTIGANMGLAFAISGTNVLVQVTPSTSNSSTVTANLEIRGPWTGYS